MDKLNYRVKREAARVLVRMRRNFSGVGVETVSTLALEQNGFFINVRFGKIIYYISCVIRVLICTRLFIMCLRIAGEKDTRATGWEPLICRSLAPPLINICFDSSVEY